MTLLPIASPVPELTEVQRQRYARQILLPGLEEEGQRRLLGARVLVVGAGGLGSPVLLYLAGAGVGTIGILDSDKLELSNLQRQVIHDMQALDTPKVTSAASRVRGLNGDVALELHEVRLTEENAPGILGQYDVVVDATDNFATRFLLDKVCTELGLPEVWGSVLGAATQVAVFWSGADAQAHGVSPEREVRLRDVFPTPPPAGIIPVGPSSPVLGAPVGQAGTAMASEVIKLLAGFGEVLLGRLALFDSRAANYTVLPVRPAAK